MNSHLVNSTFLHNKEGCPLDVTGTGEGAYMVYFVSFLGTLAVLPGNIVSALLMDKIGRLRMLGTGRGWAVVSELLRVLRGGECVNRLLTLAREGSLSHVFCLWGWLQGGVGPGPEASLLSKGSRRASKCTGFEVIGFESQLHHLPWASSLTSEPSCILWEMVMPEPAS